MGGGVGQLVRLTLYKELLQFVVFFLSPTTKSLFFEPCF